MLLNKELIRSELNSNLIKKLNRLSNPEKNGLIYHYDLGFTEVKGGSKVDFDPPTKLISSVKGVNKIGSDSNQGVSSFQPLYDRNTFNLPTSKFDGSNDQMQIIPEILYPELLTMFIVCTVSTTNGYITGTNDAGGAPGFISLFDPGSGFKDYEWFFDTRKTYADVGTAPAGLNILAVTRDNNGGVAGGSLVGHFNGAEVFDSTTTDNIIGRSFNFLGRPNISTAFYNGHIAEIMMYNRLLSTIERNNVTLSYLNQKYAIL